MKDILANRYRVTRQLGQGGMADVYLAMDTVLNREVAIKILRGELSNDPVALLRFKREASAVSELSHSNIVEIYDVGEEEGRQYIVMEYVDGQTLKQLVTKRGALYKEEAVAIMKQLVSAIVVANKKGIIHRDIKPQNVLIKADGTVKITDFGIALAQDAMQLTQQDSVMGSVHYLAPELARGEMASPQSDIYSLGIVFYELLTGEVPYRGDAAVQIAMMHIRDEMPSVKEFNPSLPQSVENVVLRSTVKNKQFRYRTADEMLMDLETVLDEKRSKEKKVKFDPLDADEDNTIVMNQINKKKKKGKKSPYPYIIGGSLTILALVGIWFLTSLVGSSGSKRVVIPNVVNMTKEEAEAEFYGLDVVLKFEYRVTDNTEIDRIETTLPVPESEVDKGSTVTVYISTGKYVTIGNYVGMTLDEVKEELASTRITIREEYEDNTSVAPGTIIRQETLMPGEKVAPNIKKEIKLVIAGYPKVSIPFSYLGRDVYEVQAELESMGMKVTLFPKSTEGMSEDELDSLQYNVVMEITPAAGTYYEQREDSTITLSFYPY